MVSCSRVRETELAGYYSLQRVWNTKSESDASGF